MKNIVFVLFMIMILAMFFQACEKIFSPEDDELFFVIKVIDDKTVAEFEQKYNENIFPVKIKLTKYDRDFKYKGKILINGLGWMKVNNYETYTANKKSFYIDTNGCLGPVKSIKFYELEISSSMIKGKYVCTGPTIDTSFYDFVGENN